MIIVGDLPAEINPEQDIALPDSSAFREIRRRGRLRVLVNSYTPQLAFRSNDGESIQGFEIDLVSRLASRIFGSGFDAAEHVELIEAPNSIKLEMLESREVDLIVANLTDTSERRKRIDMCGHYFSAREAPLRGRDVPDITNIAELAGMTVAVEAETSTVDMLARVVPNADLLPLQTSAEWIDALETGKAQLFMGDTLYNSNVANESDLEESSFRFDASHAAIGVAKGRGDLSTFVNGCVEDMLSTGLLRALQKHWKLI